MTSKSGNSPAPVPSQSGGEKISKADLASYSDRPDRNYYSAGRAAIPAPFDPVSKPHCRVECPPTVGKLAVEAAVESPILLR